MEQAIEGAEVIHRMKRGRPAKVVANEPLRVSHLLGVDPIAAAYAVRVWNGQSVDVPVGERIARVIRALEGQKLLTTGISLPVINELLLDAN